MIDFHTHPVLTQEFAQEFPNYKRVAREVFGIGNNFQPLETFFMQMEVAGIDKAVLLPVACERAHQNAVSSNEQVAELCGMSKRFIVRATEAGIGGRASGGTSEHVTLPV